MTLEMPFSILTSTVFNAMVYINIYSTNHYLYNNLYHYAYIIDHEAMQQFQLLTSDNGKIYYTYTCCALTETSSFLNHAYTTTVIDYPKDVNGVPVSRPTRNPRSAPTQRPSYNPTMRPTNVQPKSSAAITIFPTQRVKYGCSRAENEINNMINTACDNWNSKRAEQIKVKLAAEKKAYDEMVKAGLDHLDYNPAGDYNYHIPEKIGHNEYKAYLEMDMNPADFFTPQYANIRSLNELPDKHTVYFLTADYITKTNADYCKADNKPVPIVLPTHSPNFYDNDGIIVYGDSQKPTFEPTIMPVEDRRPTRHPVNEPTHEETDYPTPYPTVRAIVGITDHGIKKNNFFKFI
jgi:hypothetical protein